MKFTKEAEFEEALIKVLQQNGWEEKVIKYPTEKELIENWAQILFNNNRDKDRLNDYPLTTGEMQQILDQIKRLRTPLKLNGFINGKSVQIKRENQDDKEHFGKEVSLKIYDRQEIAGGKSRYQIVQQPEFPTKSPILNNRRGDLMLMINGMPVIHIELKSSNVHVSEACHQIKKYSHEGVFSDLFFLIQIFVAMTPEETIYFANPGKDGIFNEDYFFHWADYNNEPINDWKKIASTLLYIPMAHQLIGFYSVADDSDGTLKVMRSYQYFAASRMSDKVAKTKWQERNQYGGYIWHTTGSGKTMTSFKSAQLIENSKDADKVVFLMDRIELGTQSLKEYRNFANENDDVQATENTGVLITKLKSKDPSNTLIVTSIQKMSRIKEEGETIRAKDIEIIASKRMVFIVDECHRSTFGDMLLTIKETFPKAIFFGFTGTPIQEENQKKDSTTATVFGNELHRYSIADGIRDENVLGFDTYKVLTFKDNDIRKAVALEKAKAATEAEAIADKNKEKIYYKYMNDIPMAGSMDENGKYNKGIEDYIPRSQYLDEEHKNAVVTDILDNWVKLSRNSKFHAIFATSSIKEAIDYYKKFKEKKSGLNISVLVDPSIDNKEGAIVKEDGLKEIIEDYNNTYEQSYSFAAFDKYKKDLSARLAHKKPYERIARTPKYQMDLLIVVDQMLTGFDSKWVNTLYLDKVIEYENVIQAFSRTNRLFGPEKPFGTIKYYRKPHTMGKNIEDAVKLYSGDKPLGLFVDKLAKNLEMMNQKFVEISEIFEQAGVPNFDKLPKEPELRGKFAKLFNELNVYLEAAKVQGFTWKQKTYKSKGDINAKDYEITMTFDEDVYKALLARYKELSTEPGGNRPMDVPYDLKGYLTEIDTGRIDDKYMNTRFEKYLKALQQGNSEELAKVEQELHKSFASLTQDEQKYADIIIHDIQSGDLFVKEETTFKDYIISYMEEAQNIRVKNLSKVLGIDLVLLDEMMGLSLNDSNINEYNRLNKLADTIDIGKAKAYFEAIEGRSIIVPEVYQKSTKLIRDFILNDGFDIKMPK